jgi:hypothetical protein
MNGCFARILKAFGFAEIFSSVFSHGQSAITTPSAHPGGDANALHPRRSRAKRLTTVNRSTRLGKRIDELTAMLTAAVDGELTPMRKLNVDRAAQLTAIAELARGDFMRDGKGTLDDIVRLERKADQAVRALRLVDGPPKPAISNPLVDHFSRPPAREAAE